MLSSKVSKNEKDGAWTRHAPKGGKQQSHVQADQKMGKQVQSKQHITSDRPGQARAKWSTEPTSAFGLRSE
jgi:hypothetical protein